KRWLCRGNDGEFFLHTVKKSYILSFTFLIYENIGHLHRTIIPVRIVVAVPFYLAIVNNFVKPASTGQYVLESSLIILKISKKKTFHSSGAHFLGFPSGVDFCELLIK